MVRFFTLVLVTAFLIPTLPGLAGQMEGMEVAPIDNSVYILNFGEVDKVDRGYIIRISQPNQSFKLAGIALPEDDMPQMFLERMIKHTDSYPLYIYPMEDQTNRYSELYVMVKADDASETVQETMLRQGLVRFFLFGLDYGDPMIERLQNAEAEARISKRGIWSLPESIQDVSSLDDTMQGKLVTVTGEIADATIKDEHTYINFGDNWRSDFTLMVPSEVWDKFSQDKQFELTTPTLKILARGALSSYYGPMIKITHPAQVEIIP